MAKMTIQTAATVEPVSGEELKSHCRITEADADTTRDLAALGMAARQRVETITRRALCLQTWDQYFDCFADPLVLRLPPTSSVTSVTYLDPDGDTQTCAATVYELGEDNGVGIVRRKYNQNWPTDVRLHPDAVIVRLVAGYATAAAVPYQLKHAIKLLVGSWNENREHILSGTIVTTIPDTVNALLTPYKVRTFYA